MHSEWKVTTNIIAGEKAYAVYRLRDVSATDHSGNREFATGYIADKQEALAVAKKMNVEREYSQ